MKKIIDKIEAISSQLDLAGLTLTAEQQAIVEAADEAVERGEWHSKETILADLKAARR